MDYLSFIRELVCRGHWASNDVQSLERVQCIGAAQIAVSRYAFVKEASFYQCRAAALKADHAFSSGQGNRPLPPLALYLGENDA